jgi:alcohol dehydrogenase (cytochrome c)
MADDLGFSAVRALIPQTGELKWEYKVHQGIESGLLSTAGNVVFGGTDEGQFFALDALTGEELWRLGLGGRIIAAPVTYLNEQQQHITIAIGNTIFTFTLDN